MIDDPNDDALPHQWLEEWTVPDVPPDLSHRVMSRMHETPPLSPPLVFAHQRSATVVATGAAVFAAAAAAAALVISVARPPAPSEPSIIVPPMESPTPVATPVVVAGEMQIEKLGHLVLDVAPGDATVEIDGQPVAGPSPFVATNLPAGRHELRVHREGYEPWIKVLDVPAAELQLPITLVTEQPGGPTAASTSGIDAFVPKVAPVKATVKGELDSDIIRRVVRAHIAEVRHCYNEGLVRNPRLAGRVAVQFTIAGSGEVESSEVIESTLADKTVETCIAGAVERWRFPKPDGGGSVVVTYPFLLESE